MSARPFHHGNLRAVLLERAELMLREVGIDGISLRELAREAGVSHGAPRSHFVDRQALLDALAERGFDRLTQKVRSVAARGNTFEAQFRDVGHAYVGFAVEDAALMELMFAAKMNEPPEPVRQAAARLFATFDELMGARVEAGSGDADSRYRFGLLFAAAMQGTATLMVARRISRADGDALVDDAIDLLLASKLASQVLR